uniref:Integral membrane protein n=1 Tax=Streptomyces sp. NBC_00148 TaxID=2903626 RepID=A0AAU1M5W2_9ACTN
MTQLLPALAETGQHILLAVPDPSVGGNPPGYEKLLTVLHWVFLAVTVACVAGVLIVAGRMAISHRRGEGGEHMGSLGIVMTACVLAGSASALVATLTTA